MNNIPTPSTIAATTRGIRRGLAEIALKQAVAEGFDPAWSVGVCPICSGPIVNRSSYIGGRGYVFSQQCWLGMGEQECK